MIKPEAREELKLYGKYLELKAKHILPPFHVWKNDPKFRPLPETVADANCVGRKPS